MYFRLFSTTLFRSVKSRVGFDRLSVENLGRGTKNDLKAPEID